MEEDKIFEIESWYPLIEDCTPKTTSFPLTIQQAIALQHYFETTRLGARKYDEHDERQIELLKNSIEAHFEGYPNGAFVKLSSRSPKDAVFLLPKIADMVVEDIRVLREMYEGLSLDEVKLLAFVRQSCFALKADGVDDVMNLLGSSKRIRDDLVVACLNDDWNVNVVFREWDDRFVPENEVRVFVFKGEITCMVQYYSMLHVPFLVKNKDEICERILAFFEIIREKIHFEDYTVDVAITESEIFVVEINNPAPRAGVSLFDWFNLEEQSIVLNGPFEFRVQDHIPPTAMDEIYPPLRKFMDEEFPPQSKNDTSCQIC